MNKLRQGLRNPLTPFVVFGLLTLVWHLGLVIVDADEIFYGSILGQQSLVKFLIEHYQTWSSRTVIETLFCVFSTLPRWVWRLADSAVVLGLALALGRLLRGQNAPDNRENWLLAFLLWLYPWWYLSTAGWVVTTLNYLWPLAGLCLGFLALDGWGGRWGIAAAILGMVCAVNMEQTLTLLTEQLDRAKQSYVCVSNVHTTVMAHDDPVYRKVQAESFLTLPDGKPLSVAGRRRGFAQMGQVRGVELMERLFSDPQYAGLRHYFYGNKQKNLDTLIGVLKKEHPQLSIVGHEPSIFRELSDEECEQLARRVRASGADFLWVGLGAPRQEIFCARLQGMTGAVPIGVGGAFNVLAHIVPDAPAWMRKLSLEWFYRFIKEPRRLFKRYFVTNLRHFDK